MIVLKKSILLKCALFTILIIGYLNAVLRVSPDSGFTLFRILIPVILLYTLFADFGKFWKFYVILVVMLAYGLVNSLFISPWHSFNFVYFLHYVTLLLLFFLVKVYAKKVGYEVFYKHLKYFYIFMVSMAYIQVVTRIPFPNVELRDAPNIFFAVENDLSAALGIFVPFLIVDNKGNKYINWLLAFAGFYLTVLAEARIAMLSIIFFALLMLWDRFKLIGTIIFFIMLTVGLSILSELDIGGNNLFELFIDPVEHIVNLEPYNFGSSVTDRTDALIYGLIVYFNSWGFGIGPGNTSAKLFQDPRYAVESAESMHNFFGQVLVEYGWLIVIGIILILSHIRKVRKRSSYKKDNAFKFFLFTAVLTSLSQSEGLFSNYFFFTCLYFSIYYFNTEKHKPI